MRIIARISRLILFASILTAQAANAEELQVQCGALAGHGFYAEENLVPIGQGGWVEDGENGGESVVTIDLETSAVRYQFKDATGIWKTPESQGGETRLLSIDADGSFQFIVMFADQTIELITISELKKSVPRMIWVGTRNGPQFTSAKLMAANCAYPTQRQ